MIPNGSTVLEPGSTTVLIVTKPAHCIKSLILSKAVNNFNEAVPTFYLAIAFIVLASCTSSEVPPSSIRYYSGNPISKVVTLDKNFKIAMGQPFMSLSIPISIMGISRDFQFRQLRSVFVIQM